MLQGEASGASDACLHVNSLPADALAAVLSRVIGSRDRPGSICTPAFRSAFHALKRRRGLYSLEADLQRFFSPQALQAPVDRNAPILPALLVCKQWRSCLLNTVLQEYTCSGLAVAPPLSKQPSPQRTESLIVCIPHRRHQVPILHDQPRPTEVPEEEHVSLGPGELSGQNHMPADDETYLDLLSMLEGLPHLHTLIIIAEADSVLLTRQVLDRLADRLRTLPLRHAQMPIMLERDTSWEWSCVSRVSAVSEDTIDRDANLNAAATSKCPPQMEDSGNTFTIARDGLRPELFSMGVDEVLLSAASLRRLRIDNVMAESVAEVLPGLTHLQELSLRQLGVDGGLEQTDMIMLVSALSGLTRLTKLELPAKIFDLEEEGEDVLGRLSALTGLRHLRIVGAYGMRGHVGNADTFPHLTTLHSGQGAALEHFENFTLFGESVGVGQLPELRELKLCVPELDDDDLSYFAEMQHLTTLTLYLSDAAHLQEEIRAPFSGTGLEHLASGPVARTLRVLEIYHMEADVEFPRVLRRFRVLEQIKLKGLDVQEEDDEFLFRLARSMPSSLRALVVEAAHEGRLCIPDEGVPSLEQLRVVCKLPNLERLSLRKPVATLLEEASDLEDLEGTGTGNYFEQLMTSSEVHPSMQTLLASFLHEDSDSADSYEELD